MTNKQTVLLKKVRTKILYIGKILAFPSSYLFGLLEEVDTRRSVHLCLLLSGHSGHWRSSPSALDGDMRTGPSLTYSDFGGKEWFLALRGLIQRGGGGGGGAGISPY